MLALGSDREVLVGREQKLGAGGGEEAGMPKDDRDGRVQEVVRMDILGAVGD